MLEGVRMVETAQHNEVAPENITPSPFLSEDFRWRRRAHTPLQVCM